MNKEEKGLVVRKIANYIINDLLYEQITSVEMGTIALDVAKDTLTPDPRRTTSGMAPFHDLKADPKEIEEIARLAVIGVSEDSRVIVTRNPSGNAMWFARKSR